MQRLTSVALARDVEEAILIVKPGYSFERLQGGRCLASALYDLPTNSGWVLVEAALNFGEFVITHFEEQIWPALEKKVQAQINAPLKSSSF